MQDGRGLCRAKIRGGLVFKDFSGFNQALIVEARMEDHAKSKGFDDIDFESQVFQAFKFYGSKVGLKSFFLAEKYFAG